MQLIEKINRIFPDEHTIPTEFRVETPVRQKTYLVNGHLRQWDGPMQEVLSPVWVRTVAGLSPQVLGSYPPSCEEMCSNGLEGYPKGRLLSFLMHSGSLKGGQFWPFHSHRRVPR